MPLNKPGARDFILRHKPYCWWVALQQSPFPLRIYDLKINILHGNKKHVLKFGMQHRRHSLYNPLPGICYLGKAPKGQVE